jgi:hypothetical protein
MDALLVKEVRWSGEQAKEVAKEPLWDIELPSMPPPVPKSVLVRWRGEAVGMRKAERGIGIPWVALFWRCMSPDADPGPPVLMAEAVMGRVRVAERRLVRLLLEMRSRLGGSQLLLMSVIEPNAAEAGRGEAGASHTVTGMVATLRWSCRLKSNGYVDPMWEGQVQVSRWGQQGR